ncbi:MAG: hypothetical protein NVV82_12065 [Sporocytophaga sp.]|nr:hypothetical protein [Sporocytophaga sp.]
MKYTFTLLFGFLAFISFAQKNKEVKLNWKIERNENLSYQTVMNEIDTTTIDFNFGRLYKDFSDSTKTQKAQNLFKKLNESYKNIDLVAKLTNKGYGVVDIVLETKPKDKNVKSDSSGNGPQQMMKFMNQGVMLRGSVYETGEIHSFWVNSSQRNLIALFFQLPSKPVKIGDTWSLDINLISNDQNFICDSSFKLNKVTFVDLKKIKGETIAVLKYEIIEYVKGSFNAPSFTGKVNKTETMMEFTYQGIAEFSIDKGRWISYDGILGMEATGTMTAHAKKEIVAY